MYKIELFFIISIFDDKEKKKRTNKKYIEKKIKE